MFISYIMKFIFVKLKKSPKSILYLLIITHIYSIENISYSNEVSHNSNEYNKNAEYIEKYKKWKNAVQNPKDFKKVFSFFFDNPHWPLFDETIKITEENIDNNTSDDLVLKWFKRYSPKTSNGIISYINRLLKNDKEFAKKYIKQTWIFQNLSSDFLKEYRENYKDYITSADDARKVKLLASKNNIDQLKALKNIIVDKSISRYISDFLKSTTLVKYSKKDLYNSNKRYNIAQSFINKNEHKKAANILIYSNKDEELYDTKFFNQRRRTAFNVLRSGYPELAYKVMKMTKLNKKNKEEIAKAEWLLGYISYRFLNKLNQAKKHFEKAYINSKKDIRLSKNAFWLAEVYRSQNDILPALDWYKKASIHFSTFYGYIAHERLIDLAKDHFTIIDGFYDLDNRELSLESEMVFYNRELVQTLLSISNFEKDKNFIKHFYEKLIDEIENPDEEVYLMDIASSNRDVDLLIYKAFKKQHYFHNKKGYKQLNKDDINNILQINTNLCFISLVHSIIHRESRFNENVTSHAGAVGLMQIMPKTASYELKRMNFYLRDRSLFDRKKNILIGSFILNRLLKKYNNNIVYVAAAYNCGEGNLSKYQRSIVNLKKLTNLDIMELIPIKETRTYVKCIIRNMFTYQKIFNAGDCYNCTASSLMK